jgi:hypothetical protein
MLKQISLIQLLFIIPGFHLFAQFPAPTDFSYKLDYIELDQWGECLGEIVYGPSYCSHFKWKLPDTTSTEAVLEYFDIYNVIKQDTFLIHSLSDTTYTTSTPYEGDLFVIALYSNPQGKSEPSNIVNNPGIPIRIEETVIIPEIHIGYNSTGEFLSIVSNEDVISIRLLDVKGQIIYNEENASSNVYIGNFAPGIYFVEIMKNNNYIYLKKIIIN